MKIKKKKWLKPKMSFILIKASPNSAGDGFLSGSQVGP
jgi:hypothetical protein